ncbi:hypothetical protein CDAR_620201 [Caerostris darwini]|uniref:Transmembrane protein n=1 Tax=Caerostris darwini TaxID=1538125 RepID=A0AAV4VKS1_9ARAC|nr:hypothetical protein CDAR_620201 [Caerostris darwini]
MSVLQGWKTGTVKRKLAWRSQQTKFLFTTVFFSLLLQHFILFRIGGGGWTAGVVLQLCARKGCSFRFASRINDGVVEETELSCGVHKRRERKTIQLENECKNGQKEVPFWHFILFRIGGGRVFGRCCSATMCKKRMFIRIRIARQGGGGGGDRVELRGTQEERKRNYPGGE